MFSRRRLFSNAAGAGLAFGASTLLPAWARSAALNNMAGLTDISGNEFHLRAGKAKHVIDGKPGRAITINGQLPAPLLRWREGEDITLHLTNDLDVDTSIHWHGILLPPEMDGVPGVSFAGVKPGETFTYRFPLKQAGTYWYHSHSGFQEQSGHYGPIIIEPKGDDTIAFDRDYVIVLSDWTFDNPARVFAKLKKNSEVYNYQRRTLIDFFKDSSDRNFDDTFRDRAMWGNMRMDPRDIADVTASTYTYLVNGHGPHDNWTGLFNPGERVRLRIINASAMTIFNFRLPELPMTVVQADGLNVQPVETDEIQIGVAETYDVVVEPIENKAYTIMSESIDRSGYARATLAPRDGMHAPVPPLRPTPTLTMRDMAMAGHGGHRSGDDMTASGNEPAMDQSAHHAMNRGAMGEAAAPASSDARHNNNGGGGAAISAGATQSHNHKRGAGVDMVAEIPTNRLSDRGLGLENEPHRVLVYTDLKALEMKPDMRAPEREMELHLTGNMHRYMWSFDGEKFSDVDEPIMLDEGERMRLTLVNDTMMTHPIHLHGMFFDVVTGDRHHPPRKHTIVVKPGEKLSVDITADAVGDWAFHCHLLYHMAAGMMRVVSVRPKGMKPMQDGNHKMHHGEKS